MHRRHHPKAPGTPRRVLAYAIAGAWLGLAGSATRADTGTVADPVLTYRQAIEATDSGHFDSARAIVARLREDDPGNVAVAILDATLQAHNGEGKAAVALLESIMTTHPERMDVRNNLAVSYAMMGRLEDARETLITLPDHSEDAVAMANLAAIYTELAADAYAQAERLEGAQDAQPRPPHRVTLAPPPSAPAPITPAPEPHRDENRAPSPGVHADSGAHTANAPVAQTRPASAAMDERATHRERTQERPARRTRLSRIANTPPARRARTSTGAADTAPAATLREAPASAERAESTGHGSVHPRHTEHPARTGEATPEPSRPHSAPPAQARRTAPPQRDTAAAAQSLRSGAHDEPPKKPEHAARAATTPSAAQAPRTHEVRSTTARHAASGGNVARRTPHGPRDDTHEPPMPMNATPKHAPGPESATSTTEPSPQAGPGRTPRGAGAATAQSEPKNGKQREERTRSGEAKPTHDGTAIRHHAAAHSALAAPGARQCARIDGITDLRRLDALAKVIGASGHVIGSARRQMRVATRIRIVSPPFPSTAAAAARTTDWRERGIDDITVVTSGQNKGRISFGLYASRTNARKRLAAMHARDIEAEAVGVRWREAETHSIVGEWTHQPPPLLDGDATPWTTESQRTIRCAKAETQGRTTPEPRDRD